jgi:hypothetical protein
MRFVEKVRAAWRCSFVAACVIAAGACGPGAEVMEGADEPIAVAGVTPNGAGPAMGCADGTAEQDFGHGMFGCAGTVTWSNRASLCAPGFDVASAKTWYRFHGTGVPSHHYWTNDELHYSGSGSGSCSAQFGTGSACAAGQPMRVCSSMTPDPEGNQCNWVNCGLVGTTPADYFGGCNGNATAGTLCVAHGCADGTIEQTFDRGMVGCAGAVTNANAGQLCAAGYVVAYAQDWTTFRGSTAPTHDYWTADGPRYYTGSFFSCTATSDSSASACPATTPMRVCVPGGNDAEGNACNWTGCGAAWAPSPSNQYFGGCVGNTTAGALCVPYKSCADGTVEQNFGMHLVACAGAVTFDQRETLCAPHTIAAPADWYASMHGSLVPSHDYWTGDVLRYSGSGPSNCSVSKTTGFACPANQPMHICTPSGTDPEGNTCNWTHCGFNTTSPDQFFGGCGGVTAGVICETGP